MNAGTVRRAPYTDWIREVQRIAIEKHDFTRAGITAYLQAEHSHFLACFGTDKSPEQAMQEALEG